MEIASRTALRWSSRITGNPTGSPVGPTRRTSKTQAANALLGRAALRPYGWGMPDKTAVACVALQPGPSFIERVGSGGS